MADLLGIENLRAGYGEAVVLPGLSLRGCPEGQCWRYWAATAPARPR